MSLLSPDKLITDQAGVPASQGCWQPLVLGLCWAHAAGSKPSTGGCCCTARTGTQRGLPACPPYCFCSAWAPPFPSQGVPGHKRRPGKGLKHQDTGWRRASFHGSFPKLPRLRWGQRKLVGEGASRGSVCAHICCQQCHGRGVSSSASEWGEPKGWAAHVPFFPQPSLLRAHLVKSVAGPSPRPACSGQQPSDQQRPCCSFPSPGNWGTAGFDVWAQDLGTGCVRS